jgi:hypothetical protein
VDQFHLSGVDLRGTASRFLEPQPIHLVVTHAGRADDLGPNYRDERFIRLCQFTRSGPHSAITIRH